jgi:hypothetical protein
MRSSGRAVLALLVLCGAVFLTPSYGPARAATTFTVTESGDAGDSYITDARCDTDPATGKQCTLRAAVEEANDTAGADTIDFDTDSAASVKTISPDSQLPTITDTVTIDAYTQPGASPNTLDVGNDAVLKVQLDGTGPGTGFNGIQTEAADGTIRGLVIRASTTQAS